MVRVAFDAGAGTPDDVVILEIGLDTLKRMLSEHLAEFLRRSSWAPLPTLSAAGGRFDEPVTRALAAYIDDFQQGMLEGEKMKKAGPESGAVHASVGSPGAVMHFGKGDVTTNISGNQIGDLTSALHSFMSSPQVSALSVVERDDLARIAASLKAELSASIPAPDGIKSWGRTLGRVAEQLGVGVAGNALWTLLSGLPH